MILASVVLIVMLPILWVVFVPVSIKVDTTRNLYEVKQPGIITLSLHPGEEPFFRMRVLGFPVNTQKKIARKQTPGSRTTTRRKKMHKSLNAWGDLLRGMLRSFQCKRFVCEIDFDDVVLNAQLFPVGHLISRGPFVVNVNFERKYQLEIWIQARVHRMLWAIMRFYLTK